MSLDSLDSLLGEGALENLRFYADKVGSSNSFSARVVERSNEDSDILIRMEWWDSNWMVGSATVTFRGENKDKNITFETFWVEEHYKNKRIFSNCIRYITKWAQDWGFERAVISNPPEGPRATYIRAGFDPDPGGENILIGDYAEGSRFSQMLNYLNGQGPYPEWRK